MSIRLWFDWQIGFLVSFGESYENRKYVCIDIPFLIIQIFWFKPKKI